MSTAVCPRCSPNAKVSTPRVSTSSLLISSPPRRLISAAISLSADLLNPAVHKAILFSVSPVTRFGGALGPQPAVSTSRATTALLTALIARSTLAISRTGVAPFTLTMALYCGPVLTFWGVGKDRRVRSQANASPLWRGIGTYGLILTETSATLVASCAPAACVSGTARADLLGRLSIAGGQVTHHEATQAPQYPGLSDETADQRAGTSACRACCWSSFLCT